MNMMQQEGQLTVVTEDWSFAHLKREETLWGPHGYHRYPAKFIPQLVHRYTPKNMCVFSGAFQT